MRGRRFDPRRFDPGPGRARDTAPPRRVYIVEPTEERWMPKGKREASVVIEHEGIAFEVGRIFRGLVGQRLTNATVASYSSEVDKVTMQVQVAADDPMTTEQLCKELRELLRVAS